MRRTSESATHLLLLFISVLVHELAHSLVGRSHDIPVSNITLHLFGGVSNIQRKPTSGASKFVMALLGPVTSLVIGGALLIIFSFSAGMQISINTREALDRLSQRDVRQLPVIHEGTLAGLLHRRDIVKWLQLQPGLKTQM